MFIYLAVNCDPLGKKSWKYQPNIRMKQIIDQTHKQFANGEVMLCLPKSATIISSGSLAFRKLQGSKITGKKSVCCLDHS